MINFDEELKKFHPSLEIDDTEDAIYRFDLPCYEKIVNRLNTIFINMELSDNERRQYFIN